jgi:hypothetical protein
MRDIVKRATRSARRRIALTFLGVLVILAGSAYAVYAAGGKADFSLSASPSSQTINRGQATTYSVTVSRVNGFTGAVTLGVTGLPTGSVASWKLSNGTTSNVVPSSLNGATLTVQTANTSPTGTFTPTITGTSGNLSHSTTVTLVLKSPSDPNFTVAASPSSQSVVQGDQTSYTVTVTRSNGFSGSVSLGVTGLPSATTASWSPSSTIPNGSTSTSLNLQTASNTSTGTYALTITGSGTINGTTVQRMASATLVVQQSQSFRLSGDLGAKLSPGVKAPLNLTLNNPYSFNLLVTNLAVSVEEATSNTGCSGSKNFKMTQFSGSYPITIPPGTSTLSSVVPNSAEWPQVEMLNLATNQDQCKNATLHLDYTGSATK